MAINKVFKSSCEPPNEIYLCLWRQVQRIVVLLLMLIQCGWCVVSGELLCDAVCSCHQWLMMPPAFHNYVIHHFLANTNSAPHSQHSLTCLMSKYLQHTCVSLTFFTICLQRLFPITRCNFSLNQRILNIGSCTLKPEEEI